MHNETFYLDGVDAKGVGISLQRPIEISEPIPIVEVEEIPGRNGTVIFETGSYENRTATALCFSLHNKDVLRNIRDINKFLFSRNGYRKLETSDEPDFFWMARVENGARTEQRMRRLAPFEISFDCKPQKFAKSGQSPVLAKNGISLYNNYGFAALPLIKVLMKTGYDVVGGTVTIGNTQIYVKTYWWSWEALDARLRERGTTLENIISSVASIGVDREEFLTALDNCGSVASTLLASLVIVADSGTTEEEVKSALLIYGSSQLQLAFTAARDDALDRPLYIDCETEYAYSNIRANENKNISTPQFPTLNHGENRISWEGDISGVEITPRWWCL